MIDTPIKFMLTIAGMGAAFVLGLGLPTLFLVWLAQSVLGLR